MFEQALIYRAGVEKRVDIGLLAETLFFYRNTHLLLDRSSVSALANALPQEALLELFDRDIVKLSYIQDAFGAIASGIPTAHGFVAFRAAGTAEGKKIRNHQDEITSVLERELGDSRQTKKFAQKIADRVKLHRWRGVDEGAKLITGQAEGDLADAVFLQKAAGRILGRLVDGFDPAQPFEFRALKDEGSGFIIDTNLDYENLNAAYHKVVSPQHSSITSSFLLSHLIEARAESFFSAYYMAESVSVPIISDIIELKHFDFLRRREINTNDIKLFHEIVVPEFPNVRQVINSKQKTFSEFLKFLEEADKFKEWLAGANPDVGLVQSYIEEVKKKSWVEQLPGKAVRFAVASGVSAAVGAIGGLAYSLGVGATNTFLLDRVLKGWRPNQFIDDGYKKFVS
jgi:hypothetical protein